MLSTTKLVGTVGELAVAKDLMLKGFDVFSSIGDCSKADLVALKNDKILRVQVRSTNTIKCGRVTVKAGKTTSGKMQWAKQGDYDYVALYVLEKDQVAYVPLSLLLEGKSQSIALRLDEPGNGQREGVRWFRDFMSP